jgi:ribosomal protein S18 acetylase RimI-like enzyme
MTPHQCLAPYDWAALLTLIRTSFAGMEGRIDPPSSMHDLTPDSIEAHATNAEVWAIGTPPMACVFLTPKPDALYIGKLSVAENHRRQGHARALIDLADARARALHLPFLELQTRVELTENQRTFTALGFLETGRTAHAGYPRPTSITYRRAVG